MKNICLPKSLRNLVIATALALPVATLTAYSSLSQGADLEFTVVNKASSTLTELYLVPNYAGDWEEDILYEDISSGESGPITVADGLSTCTYDIYAAFADGDDIEDYDVDLCKLRTYTLTDRGARAK
jgi:hypothetical protein